MNRSTRKDKKEELANRSNSSVCGLIREVRREEVRNRSGPLKKLRRKHLSWLK